MEVQIVVSEWKLVQEEKKQPIIRGKYDVRVGGQTIASQTFNENYVGVPITIPAELMAKVEALSAEIKDVIVKNYIQ